MAYSNPIVAGDVLIRDAIKSENYVPGVSGWAIFRDGNAEFNNIVARGDITADSIIVPFTNSSGEDYRIAIQKANADQPEISFEFDGGNDIPNWTFGHLNIEAFDSPTGWAETTWRPMQPSGFFLGTPPNIRLQSHRAGGQAGRVDILGSTALGDGSADDAPTFQVATGYRILMPSLRHETLETSTDIVGLVNVSPPVESDTIMRFTMPYPASGVVTVHQGMQASNATVNARVRMTFEIRDTDVSGTIRAAAQPSTCANVKSYTAGDPDNASWTRTVTGLPTTGTMFIRALYSVSADTGTINDRVMTVIPSP